MLAITFQLSSEPGVQPSRLKEESYFLVGPAFSKYLALGIELSFTLTPMRASIAATAWQIASSLT